MDELIQFLHKQFDQDEQDAATYRKNMTPDSWVGISPAEVAASMDRAVATGRRAIRAYEGGLISELALKLYANTYSHRDGYRQEWSVI